MFQLILMMTLFPAQPQAIAQVMPCVWPNRCAQEIAPQSVAQVVACVWPNRCADA